ncbi:hypothetical protein [Aurantimonas sp. HBX-1]|uniref:hypothetical protein n=1 Tax=Aurantimonas sp. HBX-1 TaxID=2906072 RepID=UPI001F2B50BA|nr:hypothetical protein [Aurantimonas sp. HBX-1]UIJ73791.1 hypothetical protein LXB15_09300 [Aurantimonas sp. HBX-1]
MTDELGNRGRRSGSRAHRGTGAALALVLRTVRNRTARLLLAGGVILTGLLIWAHLAVGIF